MKKTQAKIILCVLLLFFVPLTYPVSNVYQGCSWRATFFVGLTSLLTGAFFHHVYVTYWPKKEPSKSLLVEKFSDEKMSQLPVQGRVSSLVKQWGGLSVNDVLPSTMHKQEKIEQKVASPQDMRIEFERQLLQAALDFSKESTNEININPDFAKFLVDPVIQKKLKELSANRDEYLDKQGRIVGNLSRHFTGNGERRSIEDVFNR